MHILQKFLLFYAKKFWPGWVTLFLIFRLFLGIEPRSTLDIAVWHKMLGPEGNSDEWVVPVTNWRISHPTWVVGKFDGLYFCFTISLFNFLVSSWFFCLTITNRQGYTVRISVRRKLFNLPAFTTSQFELGPSARCVARCAHGSSKSIFS